MAHYGNDDIDRTIAVNPKRVYRYALSRRLESDCESFIERPATQMDLLPQVQDTQLPRASSRFDNNFELCRFLGLPFLDEVREEFARGFSADRYLAAFKLQVSLWSMEDLGKMTSGQLQDKFPYLTKDNHRLFPRVPDQLDDEEQFDIYALSLRDEATSEMVQLSNSFEDSYAGIRRRMSNCQGVTLSTNGSLEVITYDTEPRLRVVNANGYRVGLLLADKKAAFPLVCMLRSSKGFKVEHPINQREYTLTLLDSNLTSNLRVASALAAPNNYDPEFWQQEALHGKICKTVDFACEGHTRKQVETLAIRLNTSQFCTITSIVDSLEAERRGLPVRSRIHLVQGPPGTGKTQTLAVLLNVLQNLRNRALVCAKSNMAVKELVERLIGERLQDACKEDDDLESLDDDLENTYPAEYSKAHREPARENSIADCLQPGCWLHDVCVNWYFQQLGACAPDEVLLADPVVAALLKELEIEGWNEMISLSLRLELLRRHLIILPVSDARSGGHEFDGSHWSLLVARRILGGWSYEYYDSLASRPNRQHACQLAAKVNALLEDDRQMFCEIPSIVTFEVPLQTNGFDCGIFMLVSATRICEAFSSTCDLHEVIIANVDAALWRRDLLNMLHSSEEEPVRRNQCYLPHEHRMQMAHGHARQGLIERNDKTYVGLSEVVLVANENTAKLDWTCLRAKVFLDFRKKRIKRIAKFWLGEGHGVQKPCISQPPWAAQGCDALTSLLQNPQQAWALWKSRLPPIGESVPCLSWAWAYSDESKLADQSLQHFLCFAFESILRVVDAQLVQLFGDVPSDDVKPWVPQKAEIMQAYYDVLSLRSRLVCLQSALKKFIAELLRGETDQLCARSNSQRDASSPTSSPVTSMSKDDTFQIIRSVAAAARGLVGELVDVLRLSRSGPSGCEVSEDELRKAKKQLWLLVHPDKASPELKTLATEAFKILPVAWANLTRSCAGKRVSEDREVFGLSTTNPMHVSSMFDTVNPTILEALQKCARDLRAIAFFVRTADQRCIKEALLSHSSLVFCTANSSARGFIRRQEIPIVLLDEACQCEESSTLVTLHPTLRHLILVGDPAQLPATVTSKLAGRMHYGRSTFERLAQIGHIPRLLDMQYRMEPDIVEWPNREFYGGQLQTSEVVLQRDSSVWFKTNTFSKDASHRMGTFRMLDTSRCMWEEERAGNSFRNPHEAEYIVATLREFMLTFKPDNNIEIGIITPYKAQQLFIEHLLSRDDNEWLQSHSRVSTVDGFQGQECHVIVISTVRTNESIGFVKDWRRLNVAITRAMLKCWIVGNLAALEHAADVWHKLGNYARDMGFVHDVSMPESNSERSDAACEGCSKRTHQASDESALFGTVTGKGAIWEARGQVEIFTKPILGTCPTLVGSLSLGDRCIQEGPQLIIQCVVFVEVQASGIRGWVRALSTSENEGPWLKLLLNSSSSLNHTKDTEIGSAATQDLTSPFELFFTHDRIRETFRNGSSVNNTIDAILQRTLNPSSFPPLDVTRNPDDGKLYSLSNRRLFAFRVACNKGVIVRVPVNIHKFKSDFVQKKKSGISKWERSFTTQNGGIRVQISSAYAEFQWPERCIKMLGPADPARNNSKGSDSLHDD